MNQSNEFEKKHVIDIYEKICSHFDQTRYHCWPRVKEYISTLDSDCCLADVGCGNGRNCLQRNDINYMGFEIVDQFIEICKKKNIPVKKSNILNIQSPDSYYDHTMCIAVLHHLSSQERRLQGINELLRITKKGGTILIYVWAKEQEKYIKQENNDVMIKWSLFGRYDDSQRNQHNGSEPEISNVYYRYYHLFSKGELEKLVMQSKYSLKIIERGIQKDNHYVIIQKL